MLSVCNGYSLVLECRENASLEGTETLLFRSKSGFTETDYLM